MSLLKKISCLFLFAIYFICDSQDLNGIVYYGQLESMGMKAPTGNDYISVLLFTKKKSIYITKNDSLENGHIYENKPIISGNEVFVATKATNKYGFRYFFDLTKDSLYSRDLGFRYVQEELPKIDWTISSETKKIGNFVCTQATAEFRGRNYTAWFTTEIPLPFGPWKLHGLPGLILEAYDTHKEVFFYFKNLEYPTQTQVKIDKPIVQFDQKGRKWITFNEYKMFCIESYLRAINNGRVVMESSNLPSEETNEKIDMGSTRMEIFDINEFSTKD